MFRRIEPATLIHCRVSIYMSGNQSATVIQCNRSNVYDVLPARIRACEARPGRAKCGWSEAWERGRSPTDLAERKPCRRACPAGSAYRLLSDVFSPFPIKFLLFSSFFNIYFLILNYFFCKFAL